MWLVAMYKKNEIDKVEIENYSEQFQIVGRIYEKKV